MKALLFIHQPETKPKKNQHFASVGTKLASKLPTKSNHMDYLKKLKSPDSSFFPNRFSQMTLNKKFYHYQTTNRMVYTLVLRNYLNVRAIFYLLSFRLKQKKIRYLPQISIFDCEKNRRVSLEHKSYIKYLGVLIDENLSWKNHLDCVITKISKTIGMIAKLRHFVPSSVLTNIYKSLVLPYLTYGLVA